MYATRCLIHIRYPARARIAWLFHTRQNGLIGMSGEIESYQLGGWPRRSSHSALEPA